MINEFTFIVLTFNHGNYVSQHLNSIVNIVQKYGKQISVDLIVSDDCSIDNTISVVDKWLEQNRSKFNSVKVLTETTNKGMVNSLFKALTETETEHYKFLSGDDYYMDKNIFELFPIKGALYITPVVPICEGSANPKGLIHYFRMLSYANSRGKLIWLMKYDNFIQAPGVFCDCSIYKSTEYRDEISRYRNIEDIPSWQYIIVKKSIPVVFKYEPYICYRMGNGISTNKASVKRIPFNDELKRIRKDYSLRKYKYPKYVNIFRYQFKLMELCEKKNHKQIDDLLNAEETLKKYYVEKPQ